jgi:hypothetical protein
VFRSSLQDGIYGEAIIKFDDENVKLIKRYDITITQQHFLIYTKYKMHK